MSLDKITYKHVIYDIIGRIFLIRNGVVLFYNGNVEQQRVFNLTRRIKDETEALMSYTEAYQLFRAAQAAAKIEGDMAEVGVYKGGSARIICEAKGSKPIHLFDTFEGLPQMGEVDDQKKLFKGKFNVSFEEVKERLKQYPKVHFYKGFFPATAKPVEDKKFSFVNLDVDLYESTLAGLNFFYPRMNEGGIIMSHDYANLSGVKKAFDEFFGDKPEPVVELSGAQCLTIKISEKGIGRFGGVVGFR